MNTDWEISRDMKIMIVIKIIIGGDRLSDYNWHNNVRKDRDRNVWL